MNPRNVTQKDIAKSAGVTIATVSMALRDDSRIRVQTRSKIQEIARKLGYRPDPTLSALSGYRLTKRPAGNRQRIAILNAWETKLHPHHFYQVLVSAAEKRAEELGYTTEIVHLACPPKEQLKISRELAYQGVRGLLVAPLPESITSLEMDWKYFASTAIGFSLREPHLHYAANNHLSTVETAYTKLKTLGYCKIGFLNNRSAEERNQHFYVTAYLKCLYLDGISPAQMPPRITRPEEEQGNIDWLLDNGLDAVICHGEKISSLIEALKRRGISVPDDIGICSICGDKSPYSGVMENWDEVGASAFNLLHKMLLSGERGIPKNRHSVLVEGVWQQGNSVRAQQRKKGGRIPSKRRLIG